MKILILSHTRCGSTTLCKWISKELNIELDESPYNKKTFNLVFEKVDIIRKIVIEEYLPSNDVINKFDKVICLSREKTIDASISFLIANRTNIWHNEYDVSKEWIMENKNEILKNAYRYDLMKNKLNQIKSLQITYENIYVNKTDIVKVIDHLNIKNPLYLEEVDYNNKYRKDTYTLENDFERKYLI